MLYRLVGFGSHQIVTLSALQLDFRANPLFHNYHQEAPGKGGSRSVGEASVFGRGVLGREFLNK
jgi:hypothetical protein